MLLNFTLDDEATGALEENAYDESIVVCKEDDDPFVAAKEDAYDEAIVARKDKRSFGLYLCGALLFGVTSLNAG